MLLLPLIIITIISTSTISINFIIMRRLVSDDGPRGSLRGLRDHLMGSAYVLNVYLYTYVYIYIYIYIYIERYTHIHMYICICVCVYIYI